MQLILFRSRLTAAGGDDYARAAAAMLAHARTFDGFIDQKSYTAADGEASRKRYGTPGFGAPSTLLAEETGSRDELGRVFETRTRHFLPTIPGVALPYMHDDTWRVTVSQLLARCDAVVMDLRSFGAQNRGSTHELELLATRGALSQTVLLIDQSTDRALLDSILGPSDHGGATLLEAEGDDPDQALKALAAICSVARPVPESRLHRSD